MSLLCDCGHGYEHHKIGGGECTVSIKAEYCGEGVTMPCSCDEFRGNP